MANNGATLLPSSTTPKMVGNPIYDKFVVKNTEPMGTRLEPSEERDYRKWMEKIGHTYENGMNVSPVGYNGLDYDYRGYYKEHGPVDMQKGEHFTDTYKYPNHPTFSIESKYVNFQNISQAGRWEGEQYIHANGYNKPEEEQPISLKDTRIINPVSGQPLKSTHNRSLDVNPTMLKTLVNVSKIGGVDPWRSLATAWQETNFGKADGNVGHVNIDPGKFSDQLSVDPSKHEDGSQYNSIISLVDAIKQKNAYAKQIALKKKLVPGSPGYSDFETQIYNGMSNIGVNTEKTYHNRTGRSTNSFYGVEVKNKPMNTATLLPYAKTINSLIGELKKNPDIVKIVEGK